MDDDESLRLAFAGDFVPSLLIGLLIVVDLIGWLIITP